MLLNMDLNPVLPNPVAHGLATVHAVRTNNYHLLRWQQSPECKSTPWFFFLKLCMSPLWVIPVFFLDLQLAFYLHIKAQTSTSHFLFEAGPKGSPSLLGPLSPLKYPQHLPLCKNKQ